MLVKDILPLIRTVEYPHRQPRVTAVAAEALAAQCGPEPGICATRSHRRLTGGPGVLQVLVAHGDLEGVAADPGGGPGVFLRLGADGSGLISASRPEYLYAFAASLAEVMGREDAGILAAGRRFAPAFAGNRLSFDYFLNQGGRIQEGLDRAAYVRRAAASGFTHLEVNGLAYPMALEEGVPGETYPMFYTYCPALDQFVSSRLNKGIYPAYYLSANLDYLAQNAALAREYGMVPGLTCFEPRSVPETLLARYPMLRGARVDHPFRSFKPRYNLTLAHRAVHDHYAEMMEKLCAAVPELGFIAIWTNDSGAGFEHTQSLYVGRNGGAYMIREWKDHDEIARRAGEGVIRFFRTLRDAGRRTNPDFKVITRLESFYGEHDTIWAGLGDGIETEAASYAERGWAMPYAHPRYPDDHTIIGGSIHQRGFLEAEKAPREDLAARGADAHQFFTAGPQILFDPLVGVPYPSLTLERLSELKEAGVTRMAHMGGTFPPHLVPFPANHEALRRFQLDPGKDPARIVREIAEAWAGEAFAGPLLEAWELAEEAILAAPQVAALYATFGFTWYRLWVRPLVPNLSAVADGDRAFYEDHICTTPHNPNNVDLCRDVLFDLFTPESAARDRKRMDENLFGPMNGAVARLEKIAAEADKALGEGNVITDQLVRLKALRCWFMTLRNVAAWAENVHGYPCAEEASEKEAFREAARDLVNREIANTLELAALLGTGVPFMAWTDRGETPLIHGHNLRELLDRRVALMERHRDDTPFIDEEYMMRRAAGPGA